MANTIESSASETPNTGKNIILVNKWLLYYNYDNDGNINQCVFVPKLANISLLIVCSENTAEAAYCDHFGTEREIDNNNRFYFYSNVQQMGPMKWNHNKQLITLTVITLSGVHCTGMIGAHRLLY